MKIGLIHYSCPPIVGGVEEVLNNQAMILKRLGHSVKVLAGMGGSENLPYSVHIEPLISSNNSLINKMHDDVKKGNERLLKELSEKVVEILERWSEDLDIIIAHNVLHMPFNLALTVGLRKFAELKKVPVISWAHDSPYFHLHYAEFLDKKPWNILKKIHPLIRYVTISESRKRLFEEKGINADWHVIPNGIDPVSFFYLNEKSVKLAEELRLFERDLVFVQPSRITPRKNIELSIHVVRGIKLAGYDILFLLTGAYDPHEKKAVSYYRRLKYWIDNLGLSDNIAILAEYVFKDGQRLVLDRILIRDLYLMADMLFMPSKDEGFGLPLLEAGMIKLPIACSQIPPFEEIGEDVCFFRLEDPPMIVAGKILEYLSRTNTHRMFKKSIREYTLENICKKKIIPLLEEVVGNEKTDERRDRTSGALSSWKAYRGTGQRAEY